MNKVRNIAIGFLMIVTLCVIVIAVTLFTKDKPQMSIDFFANTWSGEQITLHGNIGKTPTVLVFFDTEVEGSLEVLDKVIKNADGAEVIAVSVKSTDAKEQFEKLSDNAKKLEKLCFEGADAISKYNIQSAPVTYFIDTDGYVTGAYIGNIKEQSIIDNITEVLQK